MDLTELVNRYVFTFFFIGYSAYNPREHKQIIGKIPQRCRTNAKQSARIIILGIFIQIVAFSGMSFQNHSASNPDMGQANMFFGNFFVVTFWITNTSVVLQNLIFQNNLPMVHKKMEIIDEIFIGKLRRRPEYTKYAKKYMRNVFTCFVVLTMSVVVMIALNLNFDIDSSVSLHIYLLTYLSIAANMHALFYIDLVNFFGRFYVENVELAGKARVSHVMFGRSDDVSIVIAQLTYFKHVHFKLWDISMVLSEHFGWNLMFSCLENFIDTAYSTYWIYRFLVEGEINFSILGNLIFFSQFLLFWQFI